MSDDAINYFLSNVLYKYLVKGDILEGEGKSDAAISNFEEAIISSIEKGDTCSQSHYLSKIGDIYYRKGDKIKFFMYYIHALLVDNRSLLMLESLAKRLFDLGEYELSASVIDLCLKQQCSSLAENQLYNILGLININKHQIPDAIKCLQKAGNVQHDELIGMFGYDIRLAEALLKEGVKDVAVEYLRSFIELSPEHGRENVNKARKLLKQATKKSV